jgi:hypothetical protein
VLAKTTLNPDVLAVGFQIRQLRAAVDAQIGEWIEHRIEVAVWPARLNK